ncbi:MAG: sigma-54-dependent Fis family transcriptional regulator [Desulfobacterales bacterium]|nr:sigma-54-dependent Fis family transcriptional regulator [Desulfobacterales bacterium]
MPKTETEKPTRIIIIGDVENGARQLAEALASNYHISIAPNILDAAGQIKKDAFSAVIFDLGDEESDLENIIRTLHQLTPLTPIIVTGPLHDAELVVKAIKAGATDYITQPVVAEKVRLSINQALENRSLKNEIDYLRRQQDVVYDHDLIIAVSPAMKEVMDSIKRLSQTDSIVLMTGETGTGKSFLAGNIHFNSPRRNKPFIKVNCANIPETLMESELFGHEKGAFTGAVSRKMGKFELAKYGTVVLDEIGEMTLPLQAKLLRVLQEREIDRVGGSRSVPMHARVVAISNINLKKALSENKFREDLYYRINVVPFTIPPLRDRKGDVPLLVEHFLEKYCQLNNQDKKKISNAALSQLINNEWKGNIRELENSIERAVLIGSGPKLLPEHLFLDPADSVDGSRPHSAVSMQAGMTVREMEKQLITKTLEEVNDNRTHAAELLGISIRTLRNKLREYKQELEGSQTEASARSG